MLLALLEQVKDLFVVSGVARPFLRQFVTDRF